MKLWAALLLLATTAAAQDLTSAWQGTLAPSAGKPERIVFKISKGADGGLKAVMYNLEQGGGQGKAATVVVQGSSVRFSVPGLGVRFEGKLDSSAVSLTGTWNAGAGPQPLNLKRAGSAAAWEIPAVSRPRAMAASAPTFEVASIKPTRPGVQGKGIGIRGRTLSTANTSLSDLMTWAYGVTAQQITGAPPWAETEKFNLTARPEGDGQPNQKQWKQMLQNLLADRFHLAFQRGQKELPVYAIVVGKTGARLTRSEGNAAGLPGVFLRQPGVVSCNNASIGDLAFLMQTTVLDRPVVDQTGLDGRWDFMLTWTPDEFQFGGMGARVQPPSDNGAAPPDLFTAIQEQLGLKLVSTKAAVEVLIVDRVGKPSAN